MDGARTLVAPVRTATASDHQGTAMTAITVGTLALTRRKQLPFGQLRTTQSTAFGTRGFVGGTNDPTGLTHLGAREYDLTLGRFLSVDPVIDINDPAQMNAYSYAHNSPLTKSDPDGLRPDGPAGGASYNDDAWARDRGMNAGYTLKGSKWVWRQTPKKHPESQFLYAAYRQNTTGYLINDYYAKQRANKAAEYRAQAKLAEQRRKAEQQRKQNDIWGSIKSGLGKAWDSTGGKVVSGAADAAGAIGGFFEDHWRGLAQAGIIIVGIIAIGVCTAATAGVCAGAGGIIMSAAIGAAQGIATYGVSGGKHTTSGYVTQAAIGAGSGGLAAGVGKAAMLMGGGRTGSAPYHTVSTMTSSAIHNSGAFWKGGEYGRKVVNHMGFGTRWAD
ncbi:RHS repeat-associated core domain-containing protein [Streptomyces sp. NBC_01224]|uniref:RHS repeat-associated core domain-containing protein n=1 Tax=Streptomyces sp. NBC_01224 TaxID=2903783 RepID=UPI002E1317DB|nr:RHS repeat-associated core domain-containing protein [Streptomyces sp. NBC_01224]